MNLLRLCLCIAVLLWAPLSLSAETLNINAADADQLTEHLIGVGPSKAIAIVEYRSQHGKFKSVDDLALVKGIGAQTVEKNRDRMTVRPDGKNR